MYNIYIGKTKETLELLYSCTDMTLDYRARLQNTQIECCDALRIIQSRDTPNTFF